MRKLERKLESLHNDMLRLDCITDFNLKREHFAVSNWSTLGEWIDRDK